jgi:hypothetical protein
MAMKQTTRSILGVLALAAVALGIGFAAVWAGKDEEKKVEAKQAHDKLFSFDKSHVLVVDLVRPGVLLQVARDTPTSPWRLTLPVKAPGDEQQINLVIDAFLNLRQKRDLGDDHDLKAYGLEHSRLIAKVVFDDGKEEGLEFGIENSFDQGIYARRIGEDVVRIIDTSHKNPFDKKPFDLRSKKVAELPDGAEIRRVEVFGNAKPYTLEKVDGVWKINGATADQGPSDQLANNLKNLRATGVPADDFALAMQGEFALDPPRLKATITAVNGQQTLTRTILFSPSRAGIAPGQNISYAKREDAPYVFELENLIADQLDKDPAAWADKQLVHVAGEQVKKLVFEGPSGRVEISHSTKPGTLGPEDQFAVLAPKAGSGNRVKLAAALFALTNLRAISFAGPAGKDTAKYGLAKPMTATLLGDGDKVLAKVHVGGLDKTGKQRYVLSDNLAKVAVVERALVDDLPWTAADALEVAAK